MGRPAFLHGAVGQRERVSCLSRRPDVKQGQQLVRDVSHHCHDELWEASLHLKNAKSHRKTEVREIDREAFKEELIDALHLWIEICIVSGLSLEEVCDAYLEKGRKNRERIAEGY